MKTRWLILALLLGLGLYAVPMTRAVSESADSARISRLISQLASLKFSQRRQACRELEAIGAPALAALRKAEYDADLETCRLAQELVARIEHGLDAAEVLAPTRVRLVCKDMPVPDAIAELSKNARIEILIDPQSQVKLRQRKVTLDTGRVTFWEALDMLCAKAGLVETALQNHPIYGGDTITTWILPAQPPVKVVPQKPKGVQIQPQKPKAQPQKAKDVKAQPQQAKDVKAPPRKVKQVKAQPQQAKDVKARAAEIAALQKLVIRQVQLQGFVQAQRMVVLQDTYLVVPQTQDHSRLVLTDGNPEIVPTCYAGAFRIRARASAGKDKQSAAITFEVTAEPRHLGWNLVGDPRLEKATDERGDSLTLIWEQKPIDMVLGQWGRNVRLAQLEVLYYHQQAPREPLKRTVQIQIKLGDKSGQLRKMEGQITVESKTDRDSIVVDNILTSAGKTTRGGRGGSIKVIEVAKDKNGNHQVRFKLENPPNSASSLPDLMKARAWDVAGGQLLTGGQGPSGGGNLTLMDVKGVAFPLIGNSLTNHNGDIVQTMTFQGHQGRVPARLVFRAQRTVNVDVPFRFKGLRLP